MKTSMEILFLSKSRTLYTPLYHTLPHRDLQAHVSFHCLLAARQGLKLDVHQLIYR